MTSPRTTPAKSDARFKRTVERIGAEAFWLRTYQAAICGMKVQAVGLDFFRVSLNALKDARLVRLIRVLEDDSQTASFWYLLRSNGRLVRKAAKKAGLDLEELQVLAAKLRGIRDKAFVHIDKDGVFDTQRYYKESGLTHAKIDKVIEGLWKTKQLLHIDVFGEEIPHDLYTGEDIRRLADLRDADIA
jgi:AbiU2